MVKLALYTGPGDIFDKLIRIWTRSPYSHAELVIDGVWYSSSPRDGMVRAKRIDPVLGHWDFLPLNVIPKNQNIMVDFLQSQIGKKYDWAGIIFSQIIPIDQQDPDRWFCSEICSAALKHGGFYLRNHAQWYSPSRLHREIVRRIYGAH